MGMSLQNEAHGGGRGPLRGLLSAPLLHCGCARRPGGPTAPTASARNLQPRTFPCRHRGLTALKELLISYL